MQYKKQRLKSRENRSRYIESIISLIMESEGITQAELAKNLDISNPTLIMYLKRLREKNLLDESERLDSGGGRRPRYIKVNGDSHFSVGVQIRPEQYLVAVINMKNEVKCARVVECAFCNEAAYWESMNEEIMALLLQEGLLEKTVGIGMALPCALRMEEDDVLFVYSAQIGAINGTRLSRIRAYFDLPVYVEGEAAAAGYRYAFMSGIDSLAYMMVNDGIEGTLIRERGILRGNNGFMGLYGHVIIRAGGKKCDCGRRGCLEAYCSTNVLREYAGGSITRYWELLEKQEPGAEAVFMEYLENLALGILNTFVMMDCDVVIGGEVVEGLENYYGKLMEKLHDIVKFQKVQMDAKLGFQVILDTSDKFGPAIGAAMIQNLRFMTA